MHWRVLICSSDYKHQDLSLTHSQTRSITQGGDTPQLHTVIVRFCVRTMDALGRARLRTNYTNNVRISLPSKVAILYQCSTTETKLHQGWTL